ncbi:MAG: phosphoribosylformylglycinamidine synthase [Bacteroidales bacterium]|nr:phosphoribosylformylglycinamidine synthase [Bacteroidales bacterium]
MIIFFSPGNHLYYAVEIATYPEKEEIERLRWLFRSDKILPGPIEGFFTGPRREMITPWSTNAVEITQNMGVVGITRIEELHQVPGKDAFWDPMLQELYQGLNQDIFRMDRQPEPIRPIEDITAYNESEGLALSTEEIRYLEALSSKLGRPLTDSEVFGFSQVNSEHCRHKIFNGIFIIDGLAMEESLFAMIRKTSAIHARRLVSAYSDNVAFISGPSAEQFAPQRQDVADYFRISDIETVISLKAETHNFPTTVEPFNGAATGTGGEIRDRMAGGKGSIPLAGTAVYMTPYSRLEPGKEWESHTHPRKWRYQTPADILVKASNGASDFGNKFGQPLICGSVLTFEHFTPGRKFGFDKVIMLAGGIGYARREDSRKDPPGKGERIIVLGGDNYRIGMGGGSVSSVATGLYSNAIELNAVQRSNPEMQKRVYNAIRALSEMDDNPIISIHDHGAGGHLNSLSELVEPSGGRIDMSRLPVGDHTLSAREIIGNESQERMGLLIREEELPLLERISERERAPLYNVGATTGDGRFCFEDPVTGRRPIDLDLKDFFGAPPRTVLEDQSKGYSFHPPEYDTARLQDYLGSLLQMEAVACKDWLTNKVDRSVTGRIARQQTAGIIQLPLNNLGVVSLDYQGRKGVATSLGHAPVAGLVDPAAGSVLSVAEALTNILWAPIADGLSGISLSANWMWPARNPGENARLYQAVKSLSDFCIALGINVPTGKDSLSMTQKYPGEVVFAPGTVIVSAAGEVTDIRRVVEPVIVPDFGSRLFYIDLSGMKHCLGGSSFAQLNGRLGQKTPTVADPARFRESFEAIQHLVREGMILAGHDISAGGLITCLLEMTFPQPGAGLAIDLSPMEEHDPVRLLFSENPGVVIQVRDADGVSRFLQEKNIPYQNIGRPVTGRSLQIRHLSGDHIFDIDRLRDIWYRTSWLLDSMQCREEMASHRFRNYSKQPLQFNFSGSFNGKADRFGIDLKRRMPSGIRAAIIREKGVNGDREMAWSLYMAGFDVKDVHMTDLISGRETLSDLNMIVFVGGFSNSDVLGSARGWAGAFLFSERARLSLEAFYRRSDTLSLGVCNGCQLMVELNLICPELHPAPRMEVNRSGKFESAFLNADISENRSVMLSSMAGSRLGIWVAHGEGRFILPGEEKRYHIPLRFSYPDYPGNPNGSDYAAAAICSADGRHLAMMPHIERAVYPWQWAYYPNERSGDEISPWVEAFVNARQWIAKQASGL